MSDSKSQEKAWGGVFTESTDKQVELFTESISFDHRLYEQDIIGSIGHARMLCDVGLLQPEEFRQIETVLNELKQQIASGNFEYSTSLEDIHLHLEKALIDRLGDVGRKLHTGRSRNDQVSTDLRLWVRSAIDRLDHLLINLQQAFIAIGERDIDVVMPGYTHTQRAQPVLAAHYWLAWCEKLERDRARLADCRKRTNQLSLGAAACAGTSLPIDRMKTAAYLEFEGVAANSLDISSDRDFALEFAFVMAQTALHLSCWAEEWIWWSTVEFSFLKLPQGFCTGSSIMPQKVNPDVLELIRGKTARVVGNLQSLLMLTKGLPLAYNRDLQEDKVPLFDSFDTVEACLSVAAPLVRGTELNRTAIADRLEKGYLDATSLMEYLIRKDVPQRTAHGIVGRLVRLGMDQQLPLAKIPLVTLQAASEVIDSSVYEILGATNAVAAMKSYGSTAPEQVQLQLNIWKKKFASL